MYYSIFFFVLMVIVSGFIAYLGDYIGRYLGKKRLTFLGLRPKHTAIISTVITGMIISLLALVVLTGVNSQFRQVIFHGQTILKNNKKLSGENNKISNNNQLLTVSNRELLKEQKKLEEETAVFLAKYNKARMDLDKAQIAKERAERDKDKALKNIKILKDDVNKRKKELEILQEKDKNTRSLLEKKQHELEKVQGELDNAQIWLVDIQNDLKESISKLEEIKTQLANATQQLGQAQQELARTRRELADTQQELRATREGYDFLRMGNVVLTQNDEISRIIISGEQSITYIKSDLLDLLNKSNRICYDVIHKFSDEDYKMRNPYVESKVYAKLIFRGEDGEVYPSDPSDLIDNLAHVIKENTQTDSLILATCSYNTTLQDLEERVIFIEFKPYKNVLVYSKGDVIATKEFNIISTTNGSDENSLKEEIRRDSLIFTDIFNFFNNTVYNEILKKGIVPIRTSYLVMDNQKEIGSQIEMYLKLMYNIKNLGSNCSVNLYAIKDIYASDIVNSKNSEFEVEKKM